ncbi:hypothetical protein CERSUDRAFT_100707 [Gelatoporia subvermispora B]|uniref:Uncharacterized protein n=1 Tax=Ceriporiopsis subvermispora (strain B) TaxID=914234 RepID=M2Q2N4_CERS8|nr:hypothetical protein CERSUDRAFT_100707 [Gelatoporia subvermispora B]
MMELYLACGLVYHSDGTVSLKTPSIQKAMVYADTHTQYEVWELLPTLKERVEL